MHTATFPLWSSLPFVVILLAIALIPLGFEQFWSSNRNKGIVAAVVSLPALVILVIIDPTVLLHTLTEYFSFICLLGSLFVISGGIAVTGDLKAHPSTNLLFLLIGAVIANIIGTTGASMLLIRPLLSTNSERRHVWHIPFFFILIVSNCGGLLTPIGDPPLFLGYLRGVPFFWTLKLAPVWLVSMGYLLGLFYVIERRAYHRETKTDIAYDERHISPLTIRGRTGFLFLAGVILSVFAPTPIREGLMILMAVLSLVFGSKTAREDNRFTWHPIEEVAILFAGIFITMAPALALLHQVGPSLGIDKPWEFFWVTGALSSFLDNAPTYLTFFTLGQTIDTGLKVAGVDPLILMAISAGAVLMGANSYIGNGPNFMVKSIADHYGFKMPSFFGYLVRALAVLMPLYILITVLFFSTGLTK
ncbi:MAG: sodium:proton antiporter [Deltaproteobacteria bacterium]|nr:sodium:proton antiporter [Deltaproteobacteria bacterium]